LEIHHGESAVDRPLQTSLRMIDTTTKEVPQKGLHNFVGRVRSHGISYLVMTTQRKMTRRERKTRVSIAMTMIRVFKGRV